MQSTHMQEETSHEQLAIHFPGCTPALTFCWLAFAWIIDVRFIPREERALEKQFGDEYEEYRSQVRRRLLGPMLVVFWPASGRGSSSPSAPSTERLPSTWPIWEFSP